MPTRIRNRNNTAQSVERAFSILNFLRDSGSAMPLRDIADDLGMSTTTVHRLLMTLKKCQVVEQDPQTRQYFLSLKMLLYGKSVLDRYDWRNKAHPLLGELSKKVGETVFMGILDGFDLVYIDHVDSLDHVLRMTPQIGRRQDAHTTALGKVLLAHLDGPPLESFLKRKELARRTVHTMTNPKVLAKELERVRERGYATDQQESEIGICCVAAPVRGIGGQVVAAVSISGPSTRLEMKGLETDLKNSIQAAAARISEIAVV